MSNDNTEHLYDVIYEDIYARTRQIYIRLAAIDKGKPVNLHDSLEGRLNADLDQLKRALDLRAGAVYLNQKVEYIENAITEVENMKMRAAERLAEMCRKGESALKTKKRRTKKAKSE
jgi:hypothetical protein